MFHCNGWCFPWTVRAGGHQCLPAPGRRQASSSRSREHGVTHLCGAPIVIGMLINAPDEQRAASPTGIKMHDRRRRAARSGDRGHGAHRLRHHPCLWPDRGLWPGVVCAWHDGWDGLPIEERAGYKARQGVRLCVQEGLMVADAATLKPVPADGKTMGEIFIRGNMVMKGYLKNPGHRGSIRGRLVPHRRPRRDARDGYIEIKDRSKDIIISGGENISTHRGRGRALPPSGGAGRGGGGPA